MTAITTTLAGMGVAVCLDDDGRVHLSGLDALDDADYAAALALARINKDVLVRELEDERLMREFPHLAPCDDQEGWWVARGWCMERCEKIYQCRGWPAWLHDPGGARSQPVLELWAQTFGCPPPLAGEKTMSDDLFDFNNAKSLDELPSRPVPPCPSCGKTTTARYVLFEEPPDDLPTAKDDTGILCAECFARSLGL